MQVSDHDKQAIIALYTTLFPVAVDDPHHCVDAEAEFARDESVRSPFSGEAQDIGGQAIRFGPFSWLAPEGPARSLRCGET